MTDQNGLGERTWLLAHHLTSLHIDSWTPSWIKGTQATDSFVTTKSANFDSGKKKKCWTSGKKAGVKWILKKELLKPKILQSILFLDTFVLRPVDAAGEPSTEPHCKPMESLLRFKIQQLLTPQTTEEKK